MLGIQNWVVYALNCQVKLTPTIFSHNLQPHESATQVWVLRHKQKETGAGIVTTTTSQPGEMLLLPQQAIRIITIMFVIFILAGLISLCQIYIYAIQI